MSHSKYGDSPVIYSESPDQTRDLGCRLAGILKPNDVLLLCGDLGAGKTEFARGVALGLGITEPVNSPTFNLLLVHPLNPAATGGDPESMVQGHAHSLYHFDLYRLDDSFELEDIDYFALLEDDAISLVEWGDRFTEAMPEDYLQIEIGIQDDTTRSLIFTACGQQSVQRLEQWLALQAEADDSQH
jgi:tRNA threonylcarbamoyladenosine biosynthesis protein TsaE